MKEEAQDYRYFPEPDLPRLHIYSKEKSDGLFNLEELKKQIPELPWQKKQRLIKHFKITLNETISLKGESIIKKKVDIFLKHPEYLNFIEETINVLKKEKVDINKATPLVHNYFLTDIIGFIEKEKISWEEIKITHAYFAKVISYLVQEKISSRVAKDILLKTIQTGENPEKIIKSEGLEKISDVSKLEPIILEIIKNNPKTVEDYKKGKENALQFLVGQAMAKTRGAADPKSLEKLFKEQLS